MINDLGTAVHSDPGTSPGDLCDPTGAMIAEISAISDLDDAEAARLLRWCEARLHLVDVGGTVVSHLIINVSHAHRARPSATAILDHARTEAERRHVGIYLVGAASIMSTSSLQTRRLFERWHTSPHSTRPAPHRLTTRARVPIARPRAAPWIRRHRPDATHSPHTPQANGSRRRMRARVTSRPAEWPSVLMP